MLLTQYSVLQAQDSVKNSGTKFTSVSFVTKIDMKHATKDGIYLNGYVVNIPHEKLAELNGKTVRISGKVTVVKGIGSYTDGEARQGRKGDTKHILKPKIKVVDG